MKAFRRRFIVLNMCLAGIVLLIAFVTIGFFIGTNEYTELRSTMANVLKPWNTDNAVVSKNGSPPRNAPSDSKSKPSVKPDGERTGTKKTESERKHEHNNNITTMFYDRNEKKVTVLSEEVVFDEEADEIADAILVQQTDYGTISRYKIIYYRVNTGSMVKMAVCNEAYIGSRLIRMVLILSAAYLLAMGLLLLISFRLAKFAERPLRQSIEMERKFVADISHDLKTPITVIMANNSILKTNKDTPVSENMQWIDSTDRASEDMMQLVSNMLTMSAVDSQPKHIHTVPVSLSSAAERCVLQFESLAYEKKIELEEEIEDDLKVMATEEYLKRICSSLIDNALKYEPTGGKVIIKAYSRKHKAYYLVQNLNSKIEEEDLPHIFDRFYRSDKARTLTKGNGLGLPIISQMASLCGAEITVSSNEKEGTVFTVVFRRV